jgi:putative ABC transport system permease protein
MGRHTLKTLLAHKLRLVLTGVAIVLGVAMVAATLIAATALDRALDEAYSAEAVAADMVVRTVPDARTGVMPVIPDEVVERIAGVEGVARATGAISGYAWLLGRDGQALGTGGSDLANPPEGRSLDWTVERRLVAGRPPAGADEVAVDRSNAEREGFVVGDEVQIVGSTGLPQTFRVAAIIDVPERRGEPTVGFDLATARAVLDRPLGEFDTVNVEVLDGADTAEVADGVAAAAGRGYEVVSAAELADEQASDPRDDLTYFTGLLLLSSAVALVVGGLIIRNTLSMLVAQRTRELALLRCIGASRRQVRRSVVIEAAVIGAVASGVGVLVGLLLAGVMRSAFESLETFRNLPTPALSVAPWIVAVALGGGLVATVLFALSPARRAMRVAPVAALRDDPTDPDQRESRGRKLLSFVVVIVAVVAVAGGAARNSGTLVAVGALATLVALDAIGTWLARPVARLIGVPLDAVTGLPGRLARRNAARNPRRTAATATALTIGVGLSTFLAVWAESQKETEHGVFDAGFHADYRVHVPSTDFVGPISPEVAERFRALPELTTVTAFGSPVERSVTATDPPALAALIGEDVTAGDLRELGAGTIAVSAAVAAERDLDVGSTVEIDLGETGGRDRFRIVAVFDSYMLSEGLIEYAEAANRYLVVDYILSPQEFERLGGPATIGWIYGRVADGVSLREADAAIDGVLADYPSTQLYDRAALRTQGDAGVDAGLQVFYGIFGLIVVIALFGIVNTLTLSIVERVREVGLLRAIGLDPGDVRSMVRGESTIIAAFASVVGIALGIVFVWAMLSTASPGSDLDLDLTIPVVQLAVIAAAAVVAAVVAAIPPSIHASRVDVLRAITTE